jgi:hypothetical protein
MEFNEYTASWMLRERHAELMAAARRQALVSQARGPRRPLRVSLGTALIRTGAWLLRDHYAAREAAC